MIAEVVVKSNAGWDIDTLTKIRTMQDVIRVDASQLRPNGKFALVHIWFPTEEIAKQYMDALTGMGGTVQQIV